VRRYRHLRPKAVSHIKIQDPNTSVCAENSMNVQAREVFAMDRNRIVGLKYYNIHCLSFSIRNFVPIIESVRTPAECHTVPYGTALLGWRFHRHFVPGYDHTVPPRDISQQALARPEFQNRCPGRLNRFVVRERPFFYPDNLTTRKNDPVQTVQPGELKTG